MAGSKTLTAANSVLMIGVIGLFPAPQQLQGFATDDIFTVDDVEPTERRMGVDGRMSAGWIAASVKQTIMLQADSDSVTIFEQWYHQMQTIREVLYATGSIVVPSVQRKWTFSRGVLASVSPTVSAKKILEPRKFVIEWERVTGAPV